MLSHHDQSLSTVTPKMQQTQLRHLPRLPAHIAQSSPARSILLYWIGSLNLRGLTLGVSSPLKHP